MNKKETKNIPDDLLLVKKKREREVYYSPSTNCYFKFWVKNWTQGDIVKFCIESGYYNKENLESFVCLLEDEHKNQRGYVQRAGTEFLTKNSIWEDFIEKTSKKQRIDFLINNFENSIKVKGIHIDLHPSNMILYNNKINFIDLDSFRSFDLIFKNKKALYEERIDLNAWWEPRESALKNLKVSYKDYMEQCAEINMKTPIDEEVKIIEALELLREEYDKI